MFWPPCGFNTVIMNEFWHQSCSFCSALWLVMAAWSRHGKWLHGCGTGSAAVFSVSSAADYWLEPLAAGRNADRYALHTLYYWVLALYHRNATQECREPLAFANVFFLISLYMIVYVQRSSRHSWLQNWNAPISCSDHKCSRTVLTSNLAVLVRPG